jgi:hypothetical protein
VLAALVVDHGVVGEECEQRFDVTVVAGANEAVDLWRQIGGHGIDGTVGGDGHGARIPGNVIS